MVAKLIPRFFFEPPRQYPYKTVRRADEPPDRRQKQRQAPGSPAHPPTPNREMAADVVGMIEGGAEALLAKARAYGRKVFCVLLYI